MRAVVQWIALLVLAACAAATLGPSVRQARKDAEQGRPEAAVAKLESLRERSPHSFDVRLELGVAYYKLARKALDEDRQEDYTRYLARSLDEVLEAARIEQITDYDLLKLEIWTDGTIRPADALTEAARILMRQIEPLSLFRDIEEEDEVEEEEVGQLAPGHDVPIEDLDLAMRAYNCLKRAGITKVGEILERLERGPAEILAIRNFGQKSLDELKERLQERGFLGESTEGSGGA